MKKFAVSILIIIIVLTPTIVCAISGDRVSLGYIYNVSSSHSEIVNKTNGNINTVSPTCLDLSNDGHLVINNIFNQNFVEDMHKQNVLVTPFLSNHWSMGKAQAALLNSEGLTDEIVNAIELYNLDGVNIDLENLSSKDRDRLTEFMKMLREKMPEDKILSIAVAANPNRFTTSWVAAYDYGNLARYVDYMVLMAYDEHAEGGLPGPVASLPFVEESVKVILESCSRDKVVLGMPLYGRFWKVHEPESGEEAVEWIQYDDGGEAIIMSQVERIIERYKNAMPVYDDITGTAMVTIQVESGDKKAYVNGRYLEEGTYTIWYENEESFAKKLSIMNTYGIKGAALWAIGNEGKNFWNYYETCFYDESYESEKTIKERQYYEEVERIMKKVKPIMLTIPLKLDHKLENYLEENGIIVRKLIKRETDEKIHTETKNESYEFSNDMEEKVVEKEKYYKILEKFTIVHLIKRDMM